MAGQPSSAPAASEPKEIAPPSAIAGANHIASYEPARSVRALRATSPEVTHSSKCRRVMNTRQSVRPIAVRLRNASFGRNAKVSPIWPSVRFDDASIPRKCIRHGNCSGLRRSSTTSESKPGSAMMARSMHVANKPSRGTSSQLAKKKAMSAIGTRLRRRLSKIFHHDNAEIGLRIPRPSASGTRGSSHGKICQSPRIQRCRRTASIS